MRILIVSPIMPYPPYNGGRTRFLNLVSFLAKKHQITIACLHKTNEQVESGWYNEHGIGLLAHYRSQLFSIQSLIQSVRLGSVYAGVNYSINLKTTVKSLLSVESFDLIHVMCSYMIENIPQSLNIPLVIEEPNLESVALRQHSSLIKFPLLRWPYLREATQLKNIELKAMKWASRYICVSNDDLQAAKGWVGGDNLRVVPNGVDTKFYSFNSGQKASYPLLVFLANFNYYPNVDAVGFFIRHILPKIRQKIPKICLRILGYHADKKLVRFLNVKGVEIRGYKSDIRSDLTEGWIFVCPLRSGSGSRIKILEAMALGIPIVSTSIGCAGLPVENGVNIEIAEIHNIAESIVELVNKPNYMNFLAINARKLVEFQMTWDKSASSLESVYSEAILSK